MVCKTTEHCNVQKSKGTRTSSIYLQANIIVGCPGTQLFHDRRSARIIYRMWCISLLCWQA